MPPSAITRHVRAPRAPDSASWIAVICGTPTPATMRVVQIEPGPMPTLTPSAPWSTSALAPRGGRDVAADHLHLRIALLDPLHAVEHALRMAVRGVDDDHVDARRDQRFDALLGAVADADRGADAQPPELVLAGVRMLGRLQDVLDGDEAAQLERRR